MKQPAPLPRNPGGWGHGRCRVTAIADPLVTPRAFFWISSESTSDWGRCFHIYH